jgi:RimJ/RimL family protein N-acetyltransferase
LTTSVHEAEKLSLDQIEAFLNASEEIRFEGENREQVYGWVEQVLRQQQYPKQGRKTRGRLLARFWGRGLVSEAGVVVLKIAFQTLRMPEVVAFAAAGNVPSIRVMERLGLKCDPHKYFDHPAVTTSICATRPVSGITETLYCRVTGKPAVIGAYVGVQLIDC